MTFDPFLLRGLIVAFAAAAALPLLTGTLPRRSMWMAGLPAAIVYYGSAFPGFLVVSTVAYVAATVLGAIPDRAMRWRSTVGVLVLLVALFVAGRIGAWDQRGVVVASRWPLYICTLDMWLMLRLVTLFWEVGSGVAAVPSFGACFGWVALPMTLGGPLLRYSELPETLESHPALWRTPSWWQELAIGAVKLTAGVAVAALPAIMAEHWAPPRLLRGAVVIFVAGPLGFYLTFAGYFQVMQILARPAGIAIPDSFNWPFGRENISAFWANWNMTATRVFRDYLFYSRWGLRRHHAYVNTVVLFALVGLWHGADGYWLLWGLLHGVMFCVFLAWRRTTPRGGLRAGVPRTWADFAGRVATYICVCAAWYFPSKILAWLGVS